MLGTGAVDKMIDIAVMGINMGAVLEDFETADICLCTTILYSNSSICTGSVYFIE